MGPPKNSPHKATVILVLRKPFEDGDVRNGPYGRLGAEDYRGIAFALKHSLNHMYIDA